MSLPLQVIDRLFERLIATYGQEFVNKYQGDLNQVKSVWSHELGGFAKNLHGIAYGLENLPEFAPNVIAFKNICMKSPEATPLMIDLPKADPAIVAMIYQKLSAPVKAAGRLDWAHRIIERKDRGAKISPTVLRMAKDALGAE